MPDQLNIDARFVLKKAKNQRSVIKIGNDIECGGKALFIIAGPCSVESLEQMQAVAKILPVGIIQALRGCIYKPRTSPYSF